MAITCMGGWCTRRDRCLYYHAGDEQTTPFERLCNEGTTDAFQPLLEPEPEETCDE